MTTSKIITSRKNDNKILKFDSEIKLLKNQIGRVEETGRWLDNLQPDQVANLRSELKQKEFEKLELELLISSGLTAALAPVNGKAQTYTISAYGLVNLGHECEELLIARGIRAKNRAGTMVRYRPAGKSAPRSQIGRSITTYVVMRRVHDGWRLFHAERDYCYDNQCEFMEVIVRPAAHEDMIRHATRNFSVCNETPAKKPPKGPTA